MRRVKQVPGEFIPPPDGGEFGSFRVVTIPAPATTEEYERGWPKVMERGKELRLACPECLKTIAFRFPYEERCLHITEDELYRLRNAGEHERRRLRREFESYLDKWEPARVLERWADSMAQWEAA